MTYQSLYCTGKVVLINLIMALVIAIFSLTFALAEFRINVHVIVCYLHAMNDFFVLIIIMPWSLI